MNRSKRILCIMLIVILIAGLVVIFTKGLAFELRYRKSQRVEINLGKEFEISDIKEITNEIFEKQKVKIQAIEVYKDSVSITTNEITEDQKEQLITKLNEKYETEIKSKNIEIESVAHTRGRDILKPYIVPFVIVTIIIVGYLMMAYRKLNPLNILCQSIQIIVLSQIILLCIMAFTRMPIGKFTIPMVLIVYSLSTYICTAKFDQDLENKIAKENKKY